VKRVGDGATPPREFADRILETLAARKVPLPEDEAQFRRRLEIYAEARHPREGNAMDFAAVEALLVSAGFRIRERIDHDRRRTIPVWGGDQPAAMATRIFVASFGN
jgi:hypothetical protein